MSAANTGSTGRRQAAGGPGAAAGCARSRVTHAGPGGRLHGIASYACWGGGRLHGIASYACWGGGRLHGIASYACPPAWNRELRMPGVRGIASYVCPCAGKGPLLHGIASYACPFSARTWKQNHQHEYRRGRWGDQSINETERPRSVKQVSRASIRNSQSRAKNAPPRARACVTRDSMQAGMRNSRSCAARFRTGICNLRFHAGDCVRPVITGVCTGNSCTPLFI